MKSKIKLGMVGGGPGAFIGDVHRMAIRLDDQIELVCGAFSSDKSVSKEFGQTLGLEPGRCYETYQDMIEKECLKPVHERMNTVAIVTPNHLHYPIAKLAIERGFHVISDKPAALNLQQVLDLKSQLQASPACYAITYTYSGYPMVREARARTLSNQLGKINKVIVEYSQGWLADPEPSSKQAQWRLDPTLSGLSCCMGDIGSHAFHLAEYITGLKVEKLCSVLHSSPQRVLDDQGTILLSFDNGAQGVLLASQVATGEENNINIRVYAENACLTWSHENPQQLTIKHRDGSALTLTPGAQTNSESTFNSVRLPPGHPEGYIEAFANLYQDFSNKISKQSASAIPGIDDAIRGMAFIENAVAASNSQSKWHPFTLIPQNSGGSHE